MLLESFFSILDPIHILGLDLLPVKCWANFLLAIDRKLMPGYPEQKPKVPKLELKILLAWTKNFIGLG